MQVPAAITHNVLRSISLLARGSGAAPSDPAHLLATYRLLGSLLEQAEAGGGEVPAPADARRVLEDVIAEATSDCSTALAWQTIAATYPIVLGESGARKGGGSFYTPDSLVRHLLEVALEPAVEKRCASARERASAEGTSERLAQETALLEMRICDPACGCGTLLFAAARRLAERLAEVRGTATAQGAAMRDVLDRCIYGTDIDPVAVELCRIGMRFAADGVDRTTRNVVACDVLLDTPRAWHRTFDVVLGNPPFVDSETMARDMPGVRERIAAGYASAKGNWDLSIPFLEHGTSLLRDGGRLAMVVPSRVLSSDYAAAAQAMLLERGLLECRDFSQARPFPDADVAVAVVAASGRSPARATTFVTYDASLREARRVEASATMLHRLPSGYIGAAHRLSSEQLRTWLNATTRLGDMCSASDGATTAEAYRIRDVLRETKADQSAVRVVNTGTIDPFALLWGRRAIRYLGFQGVYPCIAADALLEVAPRRHAQAMEPAVVLAGLAQRLEAAVAPPGYLCGKSAVLVRMTRDGICPYAVAAVLNAPVMTEMYRGIFGGRGFGPGSMHIGPRQIEQMPMPDPTYLAPCERPADPESVDAREPQAWTLSAIGRWCHDAAAGGDVLCETWIEVLDQVVSTVLDAHGEAEGMIAIDQRGASCGE
jgi:methylase of polypeptide subunit release factors